MLLLSLIIILRRGVITNLLLIPKDLKAVSSVSLMRNLDFNPKDVGPNYTYLFIKIKIVPTVTCLSGFITAAVLCKPRHESSTIVCVLQV